MSILLPNQTVFLRGREPLLTTTSLGTIVPSTLYPLVSSLEIDDEHNENPLTQKQMTQWLRLRILDKWLYSDEMSYILKYLKVSGNSVTFVANEKEMNENDVEKDTEDDVEKKADLIEKVFLDLDTMRKILVKIIETLGFRWYNLASHEKIVVETVARHLRHELKEKIGK
jgi:hypothetical protein